MLLCFAHFPNLFWAEVFFFAIVFFILIKRLAFPGEDHYRLGPH